MVKKQLHKAIVEGDVAMIRLIWNYVEGMPTQSLNIGNRNNQPFEILINESQKQKIAEEILSRKKDKKNENTVE